MLLLLKASTSFVIAVHPRREVCDKPRLVYLFGSSALIAAVRHTPQV
jgi:hypothetical protein